METVKCTNCGEEIERYPYQIKKHDKFFCSKSCESEHKQESLKGENNPCWRGGVNSVEFTCDYCGDKAEARQSRLDKFDHNFCSTECRGAWHRESGLTAESNNSQWLDGRSIENRRSSGQMWDYQRKQALERDKYKCQECNRPEKDVNGYLNVHHIKPIEEFESTKEANKLSNLRTLCPRCHTALHN